MAQIRSLLLLLAILACLMAATFARADASDDDFDAAAGVEDEDPEDDYAPDAKDEGTQSIDGRVLFPDFEVSAGGLKFPAGEKVRTYVSFQNKVGGSPADLFIVAAHLNHVGNPDAFVQNFSAIRTMRSVNGGETATIHYDFRPDAMLEPMDYNLAIRIFFLNEDNATFVAVAYNSTITITEPLGIDFKAITTYFILAALIGGAIYIFTKKDDSSLGASSASGKKKFSASPADAIADDKSFNKEYVSAEHMKYREALMAQSQRAGSPKKQQSKSSSPKKRN